MNKRDDLLTKKNGACEKGGMTLNCNFYIIIRLAYIIVWFNKEISKFNVL